MDNIGSSNSNSNRDHDHNNNCNIREDCSSSLLAEALKFPSLDHETIITNNNKRRSTTKHKQQQINNNYLDKSSSTNSNNNDDDRFYDCVSNSNGNGNSNSNSNNNNKNNNSNVKERMSRPTTMKTRMMETTSSNLFETSRTSNISSDNLLLYDEGGGGDGKITTTSSSKPLLNTSISICSSGAESNASSGAITTTSSNDSKSSLIDANDVLFPQHSDFTIPTSNNHHGKHRLRRKCSNKEKHQPPLIIPAYSNNKNDNNNNNNNNNNKSIKNNKTTITTADDDDKDGRGGGRQRRSILGSNVGKKYHTNEIDRRRMSSVSIITTSLSTDKISTIQQNNHNHNHNNQQQEQQQGIPPPPPPPPPSHNKRSSRMIPKILPVKEYPSYNNHSLNNGNNNVININTDICTNLLIHNRHKNNDPHSPTDVDDDVVNHKTCAATAAAANNKNNNNHVHESIHLQSLLLGLAFMVIWLPNNAMAPNLTQMAIFFGMNEIERDLYLGSYCALALGVFSLPLSGLLGFMADFYSRKYLFLACLLLGSLSSAWSGWAPNYLNLFLARLCSGGCMSGSVPVAFSLLGDLFTKEERNAASSGLTSMMGLGIILGQIYAGEVGPTRSWQYPFYVSAVVQLIAAVMIALWVAEPVRGGKEQALQSMLKSGNKYEQKLTLEGFIHTMHKNASNWILLWQGFLTSLPWGIVFVFLNDFLSQEKGFSVQQATFLVMIFGVGCAIGGITGGYLGQFFMRGNRSHLPIYMGVSTFLGIFPFIALLNSDFPHHSGYKAKFYAVMGGLIASLPSVNIRPCIINVNPPESRGAALTAGNLFVTLGRGIGPSCIVLLGSIFHFSRQMSFNITLSVFWTISAIQLLFLAKTLPNDQDAMEEKLVQYAAAAQGDDSNNINMVDEEEQVTMSPVKARETTNLIAPRTPENRRISALDDDDHIMNSPGFTLGDAKAARRTLQFVKLGIQELKEEITHKNHYCRGCETISPSDSQDEINNSVSNSSSNNVNNGEFMGTDNIIPEDLLISEEEIQRRRDVWVQQQQEQNHCYSNFKSERED